MPQGLEKGVFEEFCSPDGNSTVKTDRSMGGVSTHIHTLTFLSGPALNKEISLTGRPLILGRGEDCDIVIPDPSVSRKHLQISFRRVLKGGNEDRIVVIRDLGSKNGTLVNYSTVHQRALKPGDKICMGRVILKFDRRDLAEQNYYEEIYRLATVDQLTSVLNKAAITRALSEEIAASLRDHRWISVLLMDVDRFKSINDLHGHLMGDTILQAIAKVLRTSVRRRDKVGRFGGDEFMIVLPETRPKGAIELAERIRLSIEKSAGAEFGISEGITASIGVASCRAVNSDCDNLLEHADAALYRAKTLGRNKAQQCVKARVHKKTEVYP